MSGLTVESTLKLGEITALHQEKFRAWSVEMSSLGSDSPTGTEMSGSVRARLWVMLAHSSPGRCREAGEAPTAEQGGFPFLFPSSVCQQRNRYFLIYRRRKSLEGQITFFSSGTDCFKPIGNK